MGAKKLAKKSAVAGLLVLGDHIKTLQSYLKEVVYELKKVVWPSRKQTIGTTAVVIIVVMIFGLYLGIVDSILSYVVRFFIG